MKLVHSIRNQSLYPGLAQTVDFQVHFFIPCVCSCRVRAVFCRRLRTYRLGVLYTKAILELLRLGSAHWMQALPLEGGRSTTRKFVAGLTQINKESFVIVVVSVALAWSDFNRGLLIDCVDLITKIFLKIYIFSLPRFFEKNLIFYCTDFYAWHPNPITVVGKRI